MKSIRDRQPPRETLNIVIVGGGVVADAVAIGIDRLGGIPVVMKRLLDAGLLHGDCMTVTGKTIAEVQSNRLELAIEMAHEWEQVVLLKGAHTIITGISDAVAETIVDMGIEWSDVETLSDLQTGLRTALGKMGLYIRE